MTGKSRLSNPHRLPRTAPSTFAVRELGGRCKASLRAAAPLLDLSSDLNTALFFATHKFSKDRDTGRSTYSFIGINDHQAVVYVLRENSTETLVHDINERSRLLSRKDLCVSPASSHLGVWMR
jgi:hypothetical protein